MDIYTPFQTRHVNCDIVKSQEMSAFMKELCATTTLILLLLPSLPNGIPLIIGRLFFLPIVLGGSYISNESTFFY